MREMKDSGIAWMNNIPEDWNNETIRHLMVGRDGGAWGEEPEEDEKGTICLRIADFDFSKGRFKICVEEDLTRRIYTTAQIERLSLKKGDILIEKSGGGEKTPVGRAVYYDGQYGSVLFANFMERLRFDTQKIDPEFMEYWLRAWYACRCSPYYINQTTGIQNINLSLMIAKERVYFPKLEEQISIVSFLDARCKEIDSIVADLQSQLDTLEQYKRSVITETVTKGLNPEAQMKQSGVEWIGEVPSNWNLCPFGYVLQERNEKNNPVKTDERLSLSIDKGITLYAEKTTNLDRYKDDVSQYKLAHKGDFVMNSMNMIVGAFDVSPYFGCVSPAYYTFYDETEDHIKARFCNYFFKMKPMMKLLFSMGKGIMAIDRGDDRVNTCRLKVSRYDLSNIPVCSPPLSEQRDIVDYLDTKIAEIEEISEIKETQIETLEEYKNSIIYEYVTGKKEVPVA